MAEDPPFDAFQASFDRLFEYWEKNLKYRYINHMGRLEDWLGVESFPTGAYWRGTNQGSGPDAVLVMKTERDTPKETPKDAIESLCEQLKSKWPRTTFVNRNKYRAVTFRNNEIAQVDLIPAREIVRGDDRYYVMPDALLGNWIRADFHAHDRAGAWLSVQDKQRIWLAKCWNRKQNVGLTPFHLEVIGIKAPPCVGDWAWDIYTFFKIARMHFDAPLHHPFSQDDRVDWFVDDAARNAARAKLDDALDAVRHAWRIRQEWCVRSLDDTKSDLFEGLDETRDLVEQVVGRVGRAVQASTKLEAAVIDYYRTLLNDSLPNAESGWSDYLARDMAKQMENDMFNRRLASLRGKYSEL